MLNSRLQLTALIAGTLSLACAPEAAQPDLTLAAPAFILAESEWSEPVNLGPPINTAAAEMNAAFSHDDLSIYFTSNRAGGAGLNDIWVSRRDCLKCPWQEPRNLGALINGEGNDAGPRLSIDGHLLFFQSDRPGGHGAADIYLSRRSDTKDDLAWGPAKNLGPGVNTELLDQAAVYLQSGEDGRANLYFNRGPVGTADIYVAAVSRNGDVLGDAVMVSELSDAAAVFDQHVTLRRDGREVFIASTRTGGLGGFDLYTATRRSVHDPWSALVPLPQPLNTAFGDQQPALSSIGDILLFASNRPGGAGLNDLWIATRTPSGR